MILINEIEEKLSKINGISDNKSFFTGFLGAYGVPGATLARCDLSDKGLHDGTQIGKQMTILVTEEGVVKTANAVAERMNGRKKTRFVVVANQKSVFALDVITEETIFFDRDNIAQYADFFLPLSGREKSTVTPEERIDAKIGARMASLFNAIMLLNQGATAVSVWAFLVSLIQLFATNSAKAVCIQRELYEYLDIHSSVDGTDMYDTLVDVMRAANGTVSREGIALIDSRLFNVLPSTSLKFDSDIRGTIIELASMPWNKTQSDYMGQIMQSIIIDGSTSVTYNYTTSENVHKVIDPLFLDEIKLRIENARGDVDALRAVRDDILNLWFFDPALNSGEFLVVVWDELNALLSEIGKEIGESNLFPLSHLSGVALNERELAVVRLNLYFVALRWMDSDEIEKCVDVLDSNHVVAGRSLLLEWDNICNPDGVVYVIGNWPYAGARRMDNDQKKDMQTVFARCNNYGDVDYAGAYFYKAVKYIGDKKGEIAFVTTNSLTQGKQVVQLWPIIYNHHVRIRFAYQAFKWSNDASNQTAVTVVILGITKADDVRNNYIYAYNNGEFIKKLAKNISPYLVPGNQMIKDLREPLSKVLPVMVKGNMPYGAEFFSFTPEERREAIEAYPEISKYLKKWIGADEMLKGKEKWCLWIRDDEVDEAKKIPIVYDRLLKCRESRLSKSDPNARKLASRPHSFREQNETTTQTVALPQLSSENYEYIPIDIFGPDVILTNLAFAVYDCEEWVFGVLASEMHNVWIRTVCGGFETRIRYSETLGYNTFPFPNISADKKKQISDCVYDIYAAREKSIGLSLGELYKKGRMTEELIQAHHRLDVVVDECYRKEPFVDVQDRIYFLFDMYERMRGEC